MKIIKLKLQKRSCPVCCSKTFKKFYKNSNYSKIDTIGNIFSYEHILVRCAKCNLIYSNPWLGYQNTNQIYKNSAIGSAFENSTKSNKHFECFKYFFPEKKSIKKNKKILEIGTATGTLLKNISNFYSLKKSNIFGIEPSKKLFQNLKNNKYFNIQNKFIHQLSRQSKFDLIILDNVLEHIEQPVETLKILKSLMNSNSKIYVSVPNLFKFKNNFRDPFGHSINYYDKNIKLLFDKCGFKIIKLKKHYQYLNFIAKINNTNKNFENNFQLDYKKKFKSVEKFIQNMLIYKSQTIQKFKKLEKKIKKDSSKIILYGCSNFALEFLLHTNISDNIIFITDSNNIYHQKKRFGKKVISPKKLQNINFDKIIITSKAFSSDIKNNLLSLNIPSKKIIQL